MEIADMPFGVKCCATAGLDGLPGRFGVWRG